MGTKEKIFISYLMYKMDCQREGWEMMNFKAWHDLTLAYYPHLRY
jgi:hypothetical protein